MFFVKRKYVFRSLSFGEIHAGLAQQFDGLFHAVVQCVNHLEVFVHVPDVAGQQGFQLCLDQRKCRAELGLVIGDSHGGALCHQLVEHGLAHLKLAVEAVERLVLLEPFFPVAVNQLDVLGDSHGGALCHQLVEHGLAHLKLAVEAVERLVLLEPFFPVAVNQLDVQLHHGAFVAQ